MKKSNHLLRHNENSHTILSILLLVVVAAMLLSSIILVRIKLLKNTHELGMALAKSYAVEETVVQDSLRDTVMIAGQFVNELSSEGKNTQDIQKWLQSYFQKLTDIVDAYMVDPYVVIDGNLIGANPWEGDADYDYENTVWYQQALEGNGEPVFSPVYRDVVTGKLVITLSMELDKPGDVMALDVYIQSDELHNTVQTLPEGYSYYLCDENGKLLYAVNKWTSDAEQLQRIASYLVDGIQSGKLVDYDAFFQDPAGQKRGTYYDIMANGWYVVITIPVKTILLGDGNIAFYIMVAVAALLFAALSFMTVQDALRTMWMKKANDTARMLGESFYAIFRINFRRGIYEAIKTAPDMEGQLPVQGEYSSLLDALCENVKPDTQATFAQSFSLESIRHRVNDKIADYGGDYQRLFGGNYRWVNVRTLYAPELAPDEVILCFRIVDAEKLQQLQHTMVMQDALDIARRSTKAKEEFFSNMSHDMRTPLNAILGFCPLIRNSLQEGRAAQAEEYLGKVEFAGNQLLSLINDVLEFSRMEAGKLAPENKIFDLQNLVENTADLFREHARETHKELTVKVDLQNSAVNGDKHLLSQILNNLLSNAFKYSDAGASIRLEVTQIATAPVGCYRFVVSDTGIGMSKEFLEHLFEPYSRETSFTAHSTVGTGLGMTIVKGLVQQMSGDIEVQSELGKGTRFTVTIPLQNGDTEPPALPKPVQKDFNWTGLRVLVAEDNELNREILCELLQMAGAEVLTAMNGAEAIQTFLHREPFSIDVILMDMRMPVIDGCQATRILRKLQRPDAASIPIVAVTANAFTEDVNKVAQAGMNGHVSKPIDFDTLSSVVQKLLADQKATNSINGK